MRRFSTEVEKAAQEVIDHFERAVQGVEHEPPKPRLGAGRAKVHPSDVKLGRTVSSPSLDKIELLFNDQSSSMKTSMVSLPHQNSSPLGQNTVMPAPQSLPSSTMGPTIMVTKEKNSHRGELSMAEKYHYDLSKAQLKASSRISALLAGFAMVALVELQYDETISHGLLVVLGVVTTLLVSVHLLALMMSTCILPYMEASGATKDSPHQRLKFFVDLAWLFSTCIGLLLFLIEIGVIFFVKFVSVKYNTAAYITTALLVPVVVIFVVFSYLIHKKRTTHSLERIKDKVAGLNEIFEA
ncbi:unnamed protein product, partial [Mesorhabditis spiculigera]